MAVIRRPSSSAGASNEAATESIVMPLAQMNITPTMPGGFALDEDDDEDDEVTTNLDGRDITPVPVVDAVSNGAIIINPNDEDINSPSINTVESLRMGNLRSSQRYPTPYTILLVGETGVGKSSVLEFIANVLKGNGRDQYDFNILDHTNEQGGSSNQSQTNAARLYELQSKNGLRVRILDTPGLADTRGLHQDELHKKSIANEIKANVDSVNAVLILANGTVPRITVGTDYALSTLSAIFPKTLTDNIAFLFTNVGSPLSWSFSQDSVPDVLKDAPQFLLDNPIALQSKYLELKNDPNMRKVMRELNGAVREGEVKALRMLVTFFDWVDRLKPQPTIEIVSLYEKSQTIEAKITNTLAQMDQAERKKWEIDRLMMALRKDSANMDAFSNFENTVNMPVWKQVPTTTHNTLCSQTNCYSNCHVGCGLNFSMDPKGVKGCNAMTGDRCHVCNHTLWDHQHYRVQWENVIDTQVTVDRNMKTKWDAARDGKEKTSALISAGESALKDFNLVIDRATSELARLAEDYAGLSLSGSFSVQMENAVRLLEQKLKGMEERGVEQEQLQKVKDSLDQVKKKLVVLRIANEKIQRERGIRNPRGGFRGQGQRQGVGRGQGWQNQGQSWPSHGQSWGKGKGWMQQAKLTLLGFLE